MARITKPLTNTEVERAKPKDKDYSLMDGQGLFLRVKSNGVKSWLFNYYKPYSTPPKRTNLGIGTYPEISLSQARIIRDEWRALLVHGIDPQVHRKEQELAQLQNLSNTFYKVAESWRLKRQNDVEPLTMEKNWQRLEKYIFPKLGNYPISNISPFLLVETLKPLSASGKSDTLHRLIRLANQILNYAVNTGLLQLLRKSWRSIQQKA